MSFALMVYLQGRLRSRSCSGHGLSLIAPTRWRCCFGENFFASAQNCRCDFVLIHLNAQHRGMHSIAAVRGRNSREDTMAREKSALGRDAAGGARCPQHRREG